MEGLLIWKSNADIPNCFALNVYKSVTNVWTNSVCIIVLAYVFTLKGSNSQIIKIYIVVICFGDDIQEYVPLSDREALECYVARGRYLFDRQSSHDVIEIYRFHHKVSCIQKYIHLIISTQWFSSWLLRMSRKLIYNLLTSLSTISAKCRRPSLHYIITTYRVLYC